MKTVLLVDDSPTILASIQSLLAMSSYNVLTAPDAEVALSVFKAGTPVDLMITDLNMPGMNGIELVKTARTLNPYKFIPMLLLTTESQQEKRMEAKQAGATGWLVKPVLGPDLLKALQKLLPGS